MEPSKHPVSIRLLLTTGFGLLLLAQVIVGFMMLKHQRAVGTPARGGDLIESSLSGEALRLARESRAKGAGDLAALYYLNAINHAPSDAELLQEYGDFVLKDDKTTPEKLRRLRSVAEISIYQVDPQSVSSLLTLIKSVESRQSQFSDVDIAPAIKPDWKAQFGAAMAVKLDDVWQDENKLGNHIEALEGLLDSASDLGAPEQSKIDQISKALDAGKTTLTASSVSKVLDQTYLNLEASVKSEPQKALSIIQTAEGLLGHLWGLDLTQLPQILRVKVNEYPQKIRSQVDKMEEAKSAPLIMAIKTLKDEAFSRISAASSLKEKREQCERTMKEALQQFQQIGYQAARNEAEKYLEELRSWADHAHQQQVDEYQKWAIKKINSAFDVYTREKSVSEEDARKFFTENGLSEINSSLLKQDTATLMNDVTGKLIAEMSGKAAFETFKEMAETTKKKLEDF